MKREDISEAVGNISTKYIQEAAPNIRVKKKPVWVKWGVVAAVFCLQTVCFPPYPEMNFLCLPHMREMV